MPNNKKHNTTHKSYARSLRGSMTDQERKLWYNYLRTCKCKFKRQVTIGNYIVDFCCTSKRIIIELDGGQHYEDAGIKYDTVRDKFLNDCGYTVLRYSNADVNNNFYAVCQDIDNHLN